MVDHKEVSQRNIARMKVVYAGGNLIIDNEEAKTEIRKLHLNEAKNEELKESEMRQVIKASEESSN